MAVHLEQSRILTKTLVRGIPVAVGLWLSMATADASPGDNVLVSEQFGNAGSPAGYSSGKAYISGDGC